MHGKLNCFQAFFDLTQYIQLTLTADQCVNSSRINTCMSEQVCQPDDVFFRPVIIHGKEMPEVMRENLAPFNLCGRAQCFHPVKDVAAVKRLPCPGDKDAA